MDSTDHEGNSWEREKKKCWYRSTHTSCIHSEIQQHKHYQFCRCFSGWGPKPVLVLCSRCFSHPAQIWTQVSSIWKQEETPLALTHLQNPPTHPLLSQNMTLTKTWLRTCAFAGIPPFRLEGGSGFQLTPLSFFQDKLQNEDPVKCTFSLHNVTPTPFFD